MYSITLLSSNYILLLVYNFLCSPFEQLFQKPVPKAWHSPQVQAGIKSSIEKYLKHLQPQSSDVVENGFGFPDDFVSDAVWPDDFNKLCQLIQEARNIAKKENGCEERYSNRGLPKFFVIIVSLSPSFQQ